MEEENPPAPGQVTEFDGRIETITPYRVEGWAWDAIHPKDFVTVEVLVEGELIGVTTASIWRADLPQAGIGDGHHGFCFEGGIKNFEDLRVRIAGSNCFLVQHEINDSTSKVTEIAPLEDVEKDLLPSSVIEGKNHDDLILIESSGLLSRQWYNKQYNDVFLTNIDPVAHYHRTGWKERRKPNAYFDGEWYRNQPGIVVPDDLDPLVHYIQCGERLGYRPIAFFDPVWYRTNYNLKDTDSSLAHYLEHATSGSMSPIPEFDVDFYLSRNSDVRSAGIDPFLHFHEAGYKEGRDPSPDFDVKFYANQYLNGSLAEDPLLHFLRRDHKSGIVTSTKNIRTWARDVKRFTSPGPCFEPAVLKRPGARKRAKILAYYLPQFHTFPENDLWWGCGFTEWTNVARGVPRFEGHFQPRVPRDLGFYELLTPGVMKKQIDLAAAAGLFGFVFYFYWFNKTRLMEAPLDLFLQDATLDFPFCLMWANENWTRRWDGLDAEALITQNYSQDEDNLLVETWLRFFRDRRYIRVDNRPVLMIYRPGVIPEAEEKVRRWRKIIIESGEANPIFVMAQGFGNLDPREYGLDGAIEFPPHKLAADQMNIRDNLDIYDPDFVGDVFSYQDVIAKSVSEAPPEFPLIKTAVPSWDNDARRQGVGMVLHGSSPDLYQRWLEDLINFSEAHPFFGQNIVCVNAWNEWAEGAYLEPDLHFGCAYLNATSRAVHELPQSGNKVCLVGHDAHPHGAQILLKSLAEALNTFGTELEIITLEGGKLMPAYNQVAQSTVVMSDDELRSAFARVAKRGFRYAIINSAASARAVEYASAAGLHVVLLVHELPSLISEKKLGPIVTRSIKFVKSFVFPAAYVRDKFCTLFDVKLERTRLIPQGNNVLVSFSSLNRDMVRTELGIPSTATVALGVGFADLRKGFDIFIHGWRTSEWQGENIYFVWVGDVEQNIKTYLKPEIDEAYSSGRFKIVPFTAELSSYYSAADVFLLTSREDPFPTVVIEALQAGLPIVAFQGSGGIPDLIKDEAVGQVVPMANCQAMVQAIKKLEDEWPLYLRVAGNRIMDFALDQFSSRNYAFKLLAAGPVVPLKVSVVVPNFNYARHLRSRMSSIFSQTYPVYEIVVLDDCSTDSSLQVLQELKAEFGRDFKVVPSLFNSGSVFRQWAKAAMLATGDYLWIAEADDQSSPGFLEQLSATFISEPEVVLSFSDSRAIDEDGKELSPSYKFYYTETSPGAFDYDNVFSGQDFIRCHLSERNIILNVSSCLWKRQALLDALQAKAEELTSFRIAGDWLLYVHTLWISGGKVAYLSAALNAHRRHAGSVTHSSSTVEEQISEIEHMQSVVKQAFPDDPTLLGKQTSYIKRLREQLTPASTPSRDQPEQ